MSKNSSNAFILVKEKTVKREHLFLNILMTPFHSIQFTDTKTWLLMVSCQTDTRM